MTAEVVESFTKEPGDGNRTVLAMGGANILSGFLGGMGGNAMNLGSNHCRIACFLLFGEEATPSGDPSTSVLSYSFGRMDPSSKMIYTHSHTSEICFMSVPCSESICV